jgi:ADP-glucose pyrophosphorylase
MTSDTITLKPFVYKSITKEKAIQNAFMNSYIRDSLRMIEYLRKMMDDENKTFLENVVSAYSSPVTFIYDQFGKKARQRSRIDRYRQIIKDENEKRDPDYAK